MKKALVTLSMLAFLGGCSKSESGPKKEKPVVVKGSSGKPLFQPPGAVPRSRCDDVRHRAWASCQAAILLKFQSKPSFRLQFPRCHGEAVKLEAGGQATVRGSFTTFNTNTKYGFRCKLKKQGAGFDLVSAEVIEPRSVTSPRPAARKNPVPKK